MENSIAILSLPDDPAFELETWFTENACDVLLHSGSADNEVLVVAELLVEGFVDAALGRFAACGGKARRPTTAEFSAAVATSARSAIAECDLDVACADGGDSAATRLLRLRLKLPPVGEQVQATTAELSVRLPAAVNGGGTGRTLWPSCFLLVEWLLGCCAHGSETVVGSCSLKGKSVLELGCGMAALPSVAALLAGARRVVASDGVSGVVSWLRQNLDSNGLSKVETRVLDWQHPPPADLRPRRFDVVLFSDAVYTQRGGLFLADALQKYTKRGGVVIGAAPGNRGGPWDDFVSDLTWRDFTAEDVQVPDDIRARAELHFLADDDSPCTLDEFRTVKLWRWRRDAAPQERAVDVIDDVDAACGSARTGDS
eukprot:TRINITY_DN18060_c0_g1_i1.p1 TRINITY_DN18060_c0_g1~~TRINITY_DN18060_c0_g1_i1.p1  ORF type:complete len:371 (-),score=68.42 TRINITY_DN18060_c0_g1_i1:355-1467(-)